MNAKQNLTHHNVKAGAPVRVHGEPHTIEGTSYVRGFVRPMDYMATEFFGFDADAFVVPVAFRPDQLGDCQYCAPDENCASHS